MLSDAASGLRLALHSDDMAPPVRGCVMGGCVMRGYVMRGYVMRGYVMRGWVMRGYVMGGYDMLWDAMLLREGERVCCERLM